MNNFEKVWNRRVEAESTRFEGYESSKVKIICEEESANYDEFISYARKRHLEEKESAE